MLLRIKIKKYTGVVYKMGQYKMGQISGLAQLKFEKMSQKVLRRLFSQFLRFFVFWLYLE